MMTELIFWQHESTVVNLHPGTLNFLLNMEFKQSKPSVFWYWPGQFHYESEGTRTIYGGTKSLGGLCDWQGKW